MTRRSLAVDRRPFLRCLGGLLALPLLLCEHGCPFAQPQEVLRVPLPTIFIEGTLLRLRLQRLRLQLQTRQFSTDLTHTVCDPGVLLRVEGVVEELRFELKHEHK